MKVAADENVPNGPIDAVTAALPPSSERNPIALERPEMPEGDHTMTGLLCTVSSRAAANSVRVVGLILRAIEFVFW
jgi:hypothetical protein